jgi:hypothetical protein
LQNKNKLEGTSANIWKEGVKGRKETEKIAGTMRTQVAFSENKIQDKVTAEESTLSQTAIQSIPKHTSKSFVSSLKLSVSVWEQKKA